ncbi:hypothetical protein F8M41_019419 [Gigaspora margarita]|uniref:Uncharacterized protein n=1 Tax=Gigaspora margarita TaxID=4874 RepID=A0A8H4EUD0_GIGMA|nr:hypothetical protein F8M41_019419 [Gigaspora margarita]
MIPRLSRQISFCEEFDRTLEKVPPTPGRLALIINNILVTITLTMFLIDDFSANHILSSNQNVNDTKLYGKYGYNYDMDIFGTAAIVLCIYFCVMIYVAACHKSCYVGCGFTAKIAGAVFSIPLTYPYLKDQIVGPDYKIIQCDQIDYLGSWQDHWCTYHQRRIILSWLLLFVWFAAFFIYLFISLWIALVVLCKRSYRILKLWVVYQYQYRKGLFLTWLKEQKEKSRQQTKPAIIKNVKSDTINKDVDIVEVVTIG